MIIKGYGTVLTRLKQEDTEQVRTWRNSSLVNQFMEFRGRISEEDQQKWFSSVDNACNNYYIIHDGSRKVGLIYGSQIDWNRKETGNGGIFIAEPGCWSTLLPVSATLLLIDISFMLGMERTYVKVLRENRKAIDFNRRLGYTLLPGQESEHNQKYVLTKEAYEAHTGKLRKVLRKDQMPYIEIVIENPAHEASILAIENYEKASAEIRKQVKLEIRKQ